MDFLQTNSLKGYKISTWKKRNSQRAYQEYRSIIPYQIPLHTKVDTVK